MFFIFGAIFILITIIAYSILAWTIIFHFKKYSIPGDQKIKNLINLFLIGSFALIAIIIIFFLKIPWQEI